MVWKAPGRRSQSLFLLCFIIVALKTSWCQASPQEKTTDTSPKKWQLKFSVGADFIPYEFDGLKIYLQRGISDNGALRFGIGLRALDRDYMVKNRIIDPPDDYNEEIDRNDDQSVLQLDLIYIGYIKSTTAIRPYVGVGPFYDRTFFGYDQDYQSFGDRTGHIHVIYDRGFLDTGVRSVMGVEWHLNSVLILQVEYSLLIHYVRYRIDSSYKGLLSTPEYVRENTYYSDFFRLNADGIKTGVSVRF